MLSDKDLEKVCWLSKLRIRPEDKDAFLGKLNQVFSWIEQLSKIDVSQINVNDPDDMRTSPERTDVPNISNTRAEVLSNTKFKKFDMFCVPKVVE